MNKRGQEILRHALGWPKYYRNRFVSGPDCDNFADCEALVSAGLMSKRSYGLDEVNESYLYVVTEAGKLAAEQEPPHAE